MTNFKGFASLVLTATIVPALAAETHCPGNVASLPFRLVNRHQIVCPYPSTIPGPTTSCWIPGCRSRWLNPPWPPSSPGHHGEAVVAGAGSRQSASIAQLDLLEAGSHAVANQRVLVYDLQNLHTDLHSGNPWRGFPRTLRPADRQCPRPAVPRQTRARCAQR